MFFTKSLKAKMLLPALIPVIFGLATLAITRPYAYKWVVQDVAEQRDTELARVLAARLSGELDHYSHILEMIAAQDDAQSLEPTRLRAVLEESPQRAVFDAGVAVYDGQGLALWPRQETGFPLATEFDELRSTLRPVFSDIFQDDASGEDVILIGLPILGSDGEFRGVMAGLSTVRYSRLGATFAEVLEFQAGRGGYAYLVDGNGRVIWHRDSSLVGASLSGTLPVRRVLQEENAAVITEDTAGETVISAFAPVPQTAWGLITQERWEGVVGPVQGYTWLRLGQLALGGALAGGLVFWLIGHILRPIQDLTKGAQRIAGGDFDHRIAARTGDEIEVLAQQFNTMAGALKESFAELEQRLAEKVRAEEALKEYSERLEEMVGERTVQLEAANKELEAFSYSVSHDLRAPLRSMDSFSAALQRDYAGQLDEKGQHYLDRIRAGTQRMGQLISDLLDLSRVTRRELVRQTVDLSALAHSIADELQSGDAARQAEMVIGESMVVEGDKHLLSIVLQNLLDNAWKFTAPRAQAQIEFGMMEQPDERVYFVRDNGVGFDMTYADNLFGPFQRLHSVREFPGTGIGLATVQRIIHRHGGRIWAEAAVDQGATFYFTIGGGGNHD